MCSGKLYHSKHVAYSSTTKRKTTYLTMGTEHILLPPKEKCTYWTIGTEHTYPFALLPPKEKHILNHRYLLPNKLTLLLICSFTQPKENTYLIIGTVRSNLFFCHRNKNLSIKQTLFVCFICHVEISQAMVSLAALLVLLKSSQWVRVYWVDYTMFGLLVEMILNIEQFFCIKILFKSKLTA
jgi:hypothetical protein